MLMTAMEVAFQTIGLCLTEYAEREDGVFKITKAALCQLVKEEIQDFVLEEEESCEKVYHLKVPLNKAILDAADGTPDVSFMNSKVYVKDGNLLMKSSFSF